MKPIVPSTRVDGVKYAIRDVVLWVSEARAAGREILPLNIGDPCPFDFDVPSHLKDAVCKAMAEGYNGYSGSHGIDEAVDAIRAEAESLYGINTIRNIFVSTGGSEAIDICLTALLEPGDNVLVPAPGYPLYTAVIGKLRAEENFYYLDENDGWQPNIDDIVSRINDRTRAIVLINPNNPTGSVNTREKLLELAEVAREHNLLVLADGTIGLLDYGLCKALPDGFALTQNFPNPFNPETVISYELPESSHVRITIYNGLGQVVDELLHERQRAGTHRIVWQADRHAPGVYIFVLEAGSYRQSMKMMLVK